MSKTPSAKTAAATTSTTAKPAAKTAHAASVSTAPKTTNAKDPQKNTSGSIGGAYETYGTPQG